MPTRRRRTDRHRARHRLGRDRLARGPGAHPARPGRRRGRPAGLPGPGRRPLGDGVHRAARPGARGHRTARVRAGRPAAPRRPPRRPAGRLRRRRTRPAARRPAGHARRRRGARHRLGARDGRPGGVRRRGPRRPARPRRGAARPAGARLLGRAGRARRARRRAGARPGRRRRRPVLRRRLRLAHRGAERPLRRPPGDGRRAALRAPASWSSTCAPAPWPACRPASTSSATPRWPRCSTAVGAVVDELGAAAVRACRHRLEHVEMVDAAASSGCATGGWSRSVQPAFDAAWGGAGGHVRRAARGGAGAGRPTRSPTWPTPASRSRWAATPRSPRWTRGAGCTPPSTTAPRARGCGPSTPSTPRRTAAGTPRAPSTPAGPLAVGAPAHLALWATDLTLSAVLAGRARPSCRLLLVDGEPIGDPHDPPRLRHRTSPGPAGLSVGQVPGGTAVSALDLDPALVARARELAARAAQPVIDLAHRHTTVSVERAVLRLAGLTGTDPVTGARGGGGPDDRVPWANRVVDAVRDQVGLESGVALPVWHALASAARPPAVAGRGGRRRDGAVRSPHRRRRRARPRGRPGRRRRGDRPHRRQPPPPRAAGGHPRRPAAPARGST